MPHAKEEKQIEKKEKLKVLIHDNNNFEDYHYLLTKDQLKLLEHLCYVGFIENVEISVIGENITWEEI